MNIFALYPCPWKSAEHMCDQHVRSKMIVESAQMLANCYSPNQLENAPLTKEGTVRKHSHYNHPCSVWVRQGLGNFSWLQAHAVALEEERLKRWPQSPVHATLGFIEWCGDNPPPIPFTSLWEFTDEMVAIPKDAACRNILGFDIFDVHMKYRAYYAADKPWAIWTAPGKRPSIYKKSQ